jgi:hypothetical protein
VQVNEVLESAIDLNLIVADNVILKHPNENIVDGTALTIQTFPVDDLVSKTRFSIDFTAISNDTLIIQRIKPKVILSKVGQADIVLETYSLNVANYPLVGGFIQAINATQLKPYKVPLSIRSQIECVRNPTLDSGNTYNWLLNYPFFIRWEHWVDLLTNIAPIDLFDATLNNNGFNYKWYRYYAVGGYNINYVVDFDFTFNGTLAQQRFVFNDIAINDFDSNVIDYSAQKIETFDASNNALINSGQQFILGYADTKVVATFTPNISLPLTDYEIVIWIETFESGGVNDIRQISSVYPVGSQSWFKSIDNSNKVVKSIVGSDVVGTCLIDFTKITQTQKFTIYARIYDKINGTFVAQKNFMDGANFNFMNGTPYQFQFQ